MPLRQVARPAARPPKTLPLVIVPLEGDWTWSKLSCSLMDEFQGAGYDMPLGVHHDAPLAMSIATGRMKRNVRPPSRWIEGEYETSFMAMNVLAREVEMNLPATPKLYSQAIRGQEGPKWQESMQREYDSHVWNKTWRLVPPPSGLPGMGQDPGKYFPVIHSLW